MVSGDEWPSFPWDVPDDPWENDDESWKGDAGDWPEELAGPEYRAWKEELDKDDPDGA